MVHLENLIEKTELQMPKCYWIAHPTITNKEKFIKFEGQYHGAHDYVLFSTASSPISAMGARRSPVPVQVGSGIPDKIRDYVYCLPFNDFDVVEKCVKDHHGEIAAIMVEPCLGNIAGIEPLEGYLAHLKKLCDDYNMVLIFDEVKMDDQRIQ